MIDTITKKTDQINTVLTTVIANQPDAAIVTNNKAADDAKKLKDSDIVGSINTNTGGLPAGNNVITKTPAGYVVKPVGPPIKQTGDVEGTTGQVIPSGNTTITTVQPTGVSNVKGVIPNGVVTPPIPNGMATDQGTKGAESIKNEQPTLMEVLKKVNEYQLNPQNYISNKMSELKGFAEGAVDLSKSLVGFSKLYNQYNGTNISITILKEGYKVVTDFEGYRDENVQKFNQFVNQANQIGQFMNENFEVKTGLSALISQQSIGLSQQGKENFKNAVEDIWNKALKDVYDDPSKFNQFKGRLAFEIAALYIPGSKLLKPLDKVTDVAQATTILGQKTVIAIKSIEEALQAISKSDNLALILKENSFKGLKSDDLQKFLLAVEKSGMTSDEIALSQRVLFDKAVKDGAEISESLRTKFQVADVKTVVEGAGKIVYKADFADHLRFVQKFDRDVSKGIVGGHNMDEFYNYFRNVEKLQDSDFIQKITKHPSIDGISQIEYKVPKLDNQGKLTGEYKYFKNPKTVYDPSKISDNQIAEWGKAAMEQGFKSGNVVGRKITGVSPNGLKFEGYMDADGIVTNFYPKLD